jgi:hypothetical protein
MLHHINSYPKYIQSIKDIYRDNKNRIKKNIKKWKLIMNIKNKIQKNKLIITKAHKGKTLVILTLQEYNKNK